MFNLKFGDKIYCYIIYIDKITISLEKIFEITQAVDCDGEYYEYFLHCNKDNLDDYVLSFEINRLLAARDEFGNMLCWYYYTNEQNKTKAIGKIKQELDL